MWSFASAAHQHKPVLVWGRRLHKPGSVWRVGSQSAPHHVTAALLCPEDSGTRAAVRRRHKPAVSDAVHGRERSAQSKWWQSETPVLQGKNHRKGDDHRIPRPKLDNHRISSELRKLSLEDFPEERQRLAIQTPAQDSGAKSHEIVFGVAPCLLALTQGRRQAQKLFVKDGEASHRPAVLKVCEEALRRRVPVQRVSKRDLDRISSGRVHQGVCLQASPLSYLTEDTDSTPRRRDTPVWLVLEGIQDPMNLGAILRSAYFLGVDRVASSVRDSCPLSPVVSKASSGAMEVLGVHGYQNLGELLRLKLEQGWQVVGTVGAEAEASQTPVVRCWDFQITKPTLLLMGGEGGGLSRDLLSLCHTLLTIPPGRDLCLGIESLNVSVATGILLHSLLSSRRTSRR